MYMTLYGELSISIQNLLFNPSLNHYRHKIYLCNNSYVSLDSYAYDINQKPSNLNLRFLASLISSLR